MESGCTAFRDNEPLNKQMKQLISTPAKTLAAGIVGLSCIGSLPTKAEPINSSIPESIEASLIEKVRQLENQNNVLRKEIETIKSLIQNSSITSEPVKPIDNPAAVSLTGKAYVAKPSFGYAQIFAIQEDQSRDTFGKTYAAEIDYALGFKTSLDYRFSKSPWGASLGWTYLDATSKGSCAHSDDNRGCIGTFTHADEEFETISDGQYINGINSFNYDDINLMATYDPADSGSFDWSFSMGLKVTTIQKDFQVDMFDPENGQSSSGTADESSSFYGIGPVVGVNASTDLFGGIKAFAGARVGILNSTLKTQYSQDESAHNNARSCRAIGGNAVCYDSSLSTTSWNPYFGATVGLDYMWKISDSFDITFAGSYDLDQYFNAVGTLKFPDDVNEGYVISDYYDLSLSGFTLGINATYKF